MCLTDLFYCNPCLNRRLLCIKYSFDEVCKILNAGFCHGTEKKK